MVTVSPWWSPERHADRRPFLLARNRIKAGFRRYFETHGFTEVECAALQVSPGNETHLHAFATDATVNGSPQRLYLHTSPEFAMKKLLAAGETRICAFSHVWRNRERGPLHSPEFTMLDWYRVAEDYAQLMQDCTGLMQLACTVAGSQTLRYRDLTCDPFAAPERLGVVEAVERYAGIDLFASIHADGSTAPAPLARQMREIGLRVADDDTWSDLLSRVLVSKVEPHLGISRPTILDRYPAAEAALARRMPGDARLAERFELYACGVELANGFGELTNATEQRQRFEAEMVEKQRVYGERYPLDEDLLAALPFMPPA
jgi:lysyl-tRNA synthetase class 2